MGDGLRNIEENRATPRDQHVRLLLHSHHDDREGAGNGAAAAGSSGRPGRWRWGRWGEVRRHREQMARLAVERYSARAV